VDRCEDAICTLDILEMMTSGVPVSLRSFGANTSGSVVCSRLQCFLEKGIKYFCSKLNYIGYWMYTSKC
jgi:hypothetical protein